MALYLPIGGGAEGGGGSYSGKKRNVGLSKKRQTLNLKPKGVMFWQAVIFVGVHLRTLSTLSNLSSCTFYSYLI